MKISFLLSLAASVAILAGCTSAPKKIPASSGPGVLAINVADAAESDINVRPNLPLEDSEAQVTVRVRNNGENPLYDVELSLTDSVSGAVIGSSRIDLPPQGSAKKEFVWKTGPNGFRQLRAVARHGDNQAIADLKIPVISRPLYFPWFGGDTPAGRKLRYANVVMARDQAQFTYWHERGVLPCLWKGVDRKKTAADYAAYLRQGLADPATGAAGIMIDEMGGYDNNEILNSNYFIGFKQFLDNNPQYFTALWCCGSLQPAYCNISRNVYRKDKGINLLMLECYSNFQVVEFSSWKRFDYFDQRIFIARQQDVLSNTVMTLAIDGNKERFNLFGYEIEDQLRYVRRHAPEMPGVGFFHVETKSPELVPVADDLCRKYFIAPVVQVWQEDLQFAPVTPKAGEKFQILAGVHNIGAMDAPGVVVTIRVDGKPVKRETVTLPALKKGEAPRPVQVLAEYRADVPGYRTIQVEVLPGAGQTLLDGQAERMVYVH